MVLHVEKYCKPGGKMKYFSCFSYNIALNQIRDADLSKLGYSRPSYHYRMFLVLQTGMFHS